MSKGFSLVELSIVLVILGLLTGGILAGQSLIRAAELRSVGTQIAQYRAAIYSFRDKYFALPGDMTNATSFWGDQATGTAACASAATADGTPGTCNGNGGGVIDFPGETYRGWQHLALAGLIEGNYVGYAIGTGPFSVAGTNVPRTKLSNVGMDYATTTALAFSDTGSNDWGPHTYGNVFFIGSLGVIADLHRNGAFKPEELWNIDTKLDDGKPTYGWIISERSATSCHTTNVLATAAYALSTTSNVCAIRALLK